MKCYVMLCYVMLCYVILCYVMLCYVISCYVMLCYIISYHLHLNYFYCKVTPNFFIYVRVLYFCAYISEGYVQGSHSYGAIPQGTPAAGTLGGTGGSVGSGAFLVDTVILIVVIMISVVVTNIVSMMIIVCTLSLY